MFSSAMKGKWDYLVYIDLFAGAGLSRIKGTTRIVPASPLLALEITTKFNKYIFCEENEEKINALRMRVQNHHPEVDCKFLPGDANEIVTSIVREIPQHGKGTKVLNFCFVDPCKLENLSFDTIKKLSKRFVDFLILIPSFMDANRNISYYKSSSNGQIAKFLGDSDWRKSWSEAEKRRVKFGLFLTDQFGKAMVTLGYNYTGIDKTFPIRSDKKNLPLYHLAFFSRHDTGDKFWREAKKYSRAQLSLDF